MPKQPDYTKRWNNKRDWTERQYNMYYTFIQARNQARYRKEDWDIDFDTYCELWGEHYEQRGRGANHYSFARIDQNGSWTPENVIVQLRSECRVQEDRRTPWGAKKKKEQNNAK